MRIQVVVEDRDEVLDVEEGYSGWAESYDDPGNDTIALEEPAVRELLVDLPPGPILDAACGTGRHAAYLSAAGREVVGIDGSEAMLERARAKLPDLDLRRGELTALRSRMGPSLAWSARSRSAICRGSERRSASSGACSSRKVGS